MTTIDTPNAVISPGNGHRARALTRRYYPLAIGAAFLGLVVGFFPSTIPISTLGYVPRVTTPRVAAPAPSSPVPIQAAAPSLSSVGSPLFPAVAPTPVATAPTGASDVTPVATAPSQTTQPSGTGKVGTGSTATCPLPLPAEPPAPPAAELIELFAAAGPFGPEATAGAPLLAPVVPVLAPLFPLAGGLAGGKSGVLLSTVLVQLANLEDQIFAPFKPEIDAITPAALTGDEKFFREIGPVLTLASKLPVLNCVGDVEIAAGATVAPTDYPGAVPLTKFGGFSSAAPDQVAVVSTSWGKGVSPAFAQAITTLTSEGRPVEVRLADDAPATTPTGAPSASQFADWIRATVTNFPRVAAWEIDPSTTTAPADPVATLTAGLRAAAEARAPGQLLGIGLPALGPGSWWPQMATALAPDVRAVLNFVGLDTTTLNPAVTLPPTGVRWLVTLVRRTALAEAGLPATMPLFVVAGTTSPEPLALQSAQASADAGDLADLGVGLLCWASPSTRDGELFGEAGGGTLLSALTRPTIP